MIRYQLHGRAVIVGDRKALIIKMLADNLDSKQHVYFLSYRKKDDFYQNKTSWLVFEALYSLESFVKTFSHEKATVNGFNKYFPTRYNEIFVDTREAESKELNLLDKRQTDMVIKNLYG